VRQEAHREGADRSCFLASDRASQNTRAIFASSLGWNVTAPSRIQRRAPPAEWPSPGKCIRTSSASDNEQERGARASSGDSELHRARSAIARSKPRSPAFEEHIASPRRARRTPLALYTITTPNMSRNQHGAEQQRV